MAMRMKDSGIEWIGEIPEDWEVRRIKHLIAFPLQYGANETGEDFDEMLPRYIRITDISANNELKNDGKLSLSNDKAKGYILQDGDVLFARSGATVGKTFYYKGEYGLACFAGYMIRLTADSRKISGRFIYYYTLSKAYAEWTNMIFIQATIQNISAEKYSELHMPVPPLPQQEKIIHFLDSRCAEIDAVIAAKQRQNELLKEQRQSIIFEAVTKGLDPTVTYKDSGVDWIGEIPAGWEVRKLKYFLEETKGAIKAGPFGSQLTSADMSYSDIKVFNQRTVLDNDFIMGNEYISLEKHEELKGFDVVAGDVLITTRGTIGKIAIVPQDVSQGIIHPCLMRVKINRRKVIDKLLLRIFNDTNMILEQLKVLSNATTIEVVYTQNLSSITLALPDLEKQQQILDFIEAKLGELDRVVAANNAVIDKLKEYRQSLIYEAVTGKIAV